MIEDKQRKADRQGKKRPSHLQIHICLDRMFQFGILHGKRLKKQQ